MSWISNIILNLGCGGIRGEELIAQVNEFFERYHETGTGLVLVDDTQLPPKWYGKQRLECCLAIGAFNHLDLDGLIRHLRTIEWPYPDDVQLIVKDQEDLRFHVIDIFTECEPNEGSVTGM